LNFLVIWTLSPTGVAGACVLLLELLALRGASLINVGALPARIVGPASAAPTDRACRRARANQGQALRVAAKRRPALTGPARVGGEI